MKKIILKRNFPLHSPLSVIDRKDIVLLIGFILVLSCSITGCGSNNQQQSILPVTEPIARENPAQEAPAQEVPAQEVPAQEAQNQSVPEKVETEAEAETEAETDAPTPDVSSSSPSYLGTWQITSSTFGAYSAMSEEDCSALVGTRFEYFKDYAIYDDQHRLDSPQYIESILTADDFSSIYQGTSLETLGISRDSIQVVAIENASGIGDTFYIKDENTLIIPWDGVFFEVQRISSDS